MSEEEWTETGPIHESGYARRARLRRRRMLVTLGLVALLLFFAFWYALSYYQKGPEPRATPTNCPTVTATVKPSSFRLNVYNATDREGLAGSTSKALANRGFTIGAVANDPLKKKVVKSAEIRSSKAGAKNAALVARQVHGAALVVDKRKDASVDLVLGKAFKALTTPAKATAPTLPKGCPTR